MIFVIFFYIAIMLDVCFKHGQSSKTWGERINVKMLTASQQPALNASFAKLPLLPPCDDIRLFTHAHKQPSLGWFCSCGCSMGCLRCPLAYFKHPIITVCFHSLPSHWKAAEAQLSGVSQSEHSWALKRQELKWSIWDRG